MLSISQWKNHSNILPKISKRETGGKFLTVCLSPFWQIVTIFTCFYSKGNLPVLKNIKNISKSKKLPKSKIYQSSLRSLQPFKKLLTLVSIWNRPLQKKFSFYFSRVFC